MTHEEFLNDWKERYLKNTCTYEHLLRLHKIGKLTKEEVDMIENLKKEVV